MLKILLAEIYYWFYNSSKGEDINLVIYNKPLNSEISPRQEIDTLYQQNWEVIKTSIQNNIRWLLADTQFC
ncbi:MAG: hypothetical protein O7C60_02475 [Rickettsia endosymbiont of Ixodes persulcatus]|nr:hypothetical protein [Rickettsia endosymbiont of Ixodes persulcatus]